MTAPNPCINCKWMKLSKTGQPVCVVNMNLCIFNRGWNGDCTKAGKWFEPKED